MICVGEWRNERLLRDGLSVECDSTLRPVMRSFSGLAPSSHTHEGVVAKHCGFHVESRYRLIGQIVAYRGRLESSRR